jgi:atlastin
MVCHCDFSIKGGVCYGDQANIIHFSEEKGIIVDSEEMAKIFLHPEVVDRNVIVISIVGAFRTGKSFILSYFLKYLYANVSD